MHSDRAGGVGGPDSRLDPAGTAGSATGPAAFDYRGSVHRLRRGDVRRPNRRREQVHLRHRRRLELAREGSHRLLARPTPQVPWPAGHDVQARPVHQRRPGHDEPGRARRGLRHRGRRRDRPRPRALRALHRREPVQALQHHDRVDLPLGHREGAPGRLPRAHGAGHPARHRRDQGPGPAAGRRRRRHRHRRDRRHGGRHRDRPLHRGHPPVPPGRRPRQRLLRAPHPGARTW